MHTLVEKGIDVRYPGQILNSILDSDLYKFSMQAAILKYKQGVPVRYVFNDRRPDKKFNSAFESALHNAIEAMMNLRLTSDEAEWLYETCPFLGREYIAYLSNYQYDPSEVTFRVEDGELHLEIYGTWERTILWEVPLMALISQLYFIYCDDNWYYDKNEQITEFYRKSQVLAGFSWADFGTRRRRSYDTQRLAIESFKVSRGSKWFVGTSNVHFAHKCGVRPIGTQAHEWFMGISALEGLRHANRHGMRIWSQIYKGSLGIALTDTFGSDAFFRDFDLTLSKLFDGVRHDSGDPYLFAEKVISHYRGLDIDPMSKTIVFSDGLSPEAAVDIGGFCSGRVGTSLLAIGTNFTNDFPGSRPLNMVIKLWSCDGVPVVKLSDSLGKQTGDPDALRVANWTFHNQFDPAHNIKEYPA